MKLTSSCSDSKTLNANNMETLIECQSEGDIKKHPLLASSESEDSICQLIEIKKRKKVLSWPFLMRRLPPSSDFPGASEPELKASLFDQPLSIICDGDTLPRPIQDILAILCLKGPSTEGIFRKAANEKARKELKEELNAGVAVDLESLPVHLLAVVLKDFLRSIPQTLLCCDLFEEWMGALEKQAEEDRIEALKRVADQLPRPNLLLLKPLLSVLFLISKNCETSKMDGSNLAICVGPNMLARSNAPSLSLEAEKDLSHQVKMLVECLIENCLEIFGEHIPAHSSITSDDSLEHTDSSDVSTLQSDSAYDSNDPDMEASGSRVSSPSSQCALGDLDKSCSEPSARTSLGCLEGRDPDPGLAGGNKADPRLTLGFEDVEDPFPEEELPPGGPQAPPDLSRASGTQDAGSSCSPEAPSSEAPDTSSADPAPAPLSSPRRSPFLRHQSFTKGERSQPRREIKKHSLSFSFAPRRRGPAKPPSMDSAGPSGSSRDSAARGGRKENRLASRVVRDSWCERQGLPAPDGGARPCVLLCAKDVFRWVDERRPGSPPSYQEAVQGQVPELAACGGQTVGSMRARMLGRTPCSQEPLDGRRTEHWAQSRPTGAASETTGRVASVQRPELYRLRALSESKQQGRRADLVRTSSQPVFEARRLLEARESYI